MLTHAGMKKYDPTRSLVLRNTFSRELKKRMKKVQKIIREAITQRDCFGLTKESIIQQQMQLPGYRQFAHPNDSEKIGAFLDWLKSLIEAELIDMVNIGSNVGSAWTTKYIKEAYSRGIRRARNELRKAGYDVSDIEETGGVESALKVPTHSQVLDNLSYRMLSTLEGAADSLKRYISMVLSDSFQKAHTPDYIARRIDSIFTGDDKDELGLMIILFKFVPMYQRLDQIARSEIVRSIAESALTEYEFWDVAEVGLMAEWVTAGDNRVCPRCNSMAAMGPYPIEQIKGLIPLHPLCRCFWIPVDIN